MNLNPASSASQNLSLFQVEWAQVPYEAPQVYFHSAIAPYMYDVSTWRPLVPTARLVDVINQLRDVKRLSRIQNAAIQQASREILQVAKMFCENWNQHPGLCIQLDCTATKQNPHVRLFWIIAIAAMTLCGEKICYYEADDDGISVHDLWGVKHYSRWATVSSFYRQLQSLRPRQPPQKRQPSNEETPEVGTVEEQALSTTFRRNEPGLDVRVTRSEGGLSRDFETVVNDVYSAWLLNDLEVPPELQRRPNEDQLWVMSANGLA